MKITFYGAAQTTTGSMHLVEANGKKILLDCGLYQGHRKEAFEKNRNLPIDPKTIDYVILSHAHIDHSGNLPQLVRQGFRGRVFARQSTVELCNVMLRDSCFLQKRDLEYVNKKRKRDGKNLFEPLYDEKDVDVLMQLFVPTHMHEPREISRGITLEFFNAGHILGSALVQLDIRSDHGHNHRLLFSGDLGQSNQPILRHCEYPSGADILLVESTYADRFHPSADDVELMSLQRDKFVAFGFDFAVVDSNTVEFTSLPADVERSAIEDVVYDMLDSLRDGIGVSERQRKERLAAILSWNRGVKALSEGEVEAVLDSLEGCRECSLTYDGRPVVRLVEPADIKALFLN